MKKIYRFLYGKYKGKSLDCVPESYLEWWLTNIVCSEGFYLAGLNRLERTSLPTSVNNHFLTDRTINF